MIEEINNGKYVRIISTSYRSNKPVELITLLCDAGVDPEEVYTFHLANQSSKAFNAMKSACEGFIKTCETNKFSAGVIHQSAQEIGDALALVDKIEEVEDLPDEVYGETKDALPTEMVLSEYTRWIYTFHKGTVKEGKLALVQEFLKSDNFEKMKRDGK
jgi:hypothetical protein